MKQWNGLLKKEWLSMRGLLLASALLGIIAMSFLPLLLSKSFGSEERIFEFTIVICFIWASATVVVPGVALFTMLEKDMKRPDVWLHSDASIFKLVGLKVFLATLIGAVGLLIPTMVLAVQYALLAPSIMTIDALLFYGSIFVVVSFGGSISIMAIGYFFWVIYRLLKPYLIGFSIPITILLFCFSLLVVERIGRTEIYSKMVNVGRIDLLPLKKDIFDDGNGYFTLTETTFYMGEVVFGIFFITIMFVVATVLFEKKVRL
ncbi:hypothetical protein [Psychrobacillus sp.]|uniref:hypothetical protein n=1 Tax=Psychrobacillus sp. TaxID=1871623 RepID=UPI0028BE2C92|nr:hypothetical protein [Psychrobacillus sp.]